MSETRKLAAILFSDVEPLELLYVQLSPTVVGNGREPEDTTTEDCEAALVADAVEPVPEVAAPEVVLAGVEPAAVEPDPRACMEKGVNLKEFADTLQIYQGSLYVNDFNMFGRTWQVRAGLCRRSSR